MRFSIFGYVLGLAAVFAIPVMGLSNSLDSLGLPIKDYHLHGQDFGSDYEDEMISVGSEVESIGK